MIVKLGQTACCLNLGPQLYMQYTVPAIVLILRAIVFTRTSGCDNGIRPNALVQMSTRGLTESRIHMNGDRADRDGDSL
jgi:hypothetical protein